jgi:Salmonella virulence plasmid 65kDa B protein
VQPDLASAEWLFEVVFDYGEHDPDRPTPRELVPWVCRADPFSTYRAGFEVRTYRLCQRILMFHHVPDEEAVGTDCLVRSTDFTYRGDPRRGEPTLVGVGRGDAAVYLADMCGDDLADLVRIRNGEVCYWPNLGYGRFGAKVGMDGSPWLDDAAERASS